MSDVMPYSSTRYQDMNDEMMGQWEKAFHEQIHEAVSVFQPELIISHHLWILTALVKKIVPNIPVVGICHGTCLRQLILAEKFAHSVIEGCRKCDLVFALNNYQKEKIVEDYGIKEEKILVLGNGFLNKYFYLPEGKKEDGTVRLVYAGKLSRAKGFFSLLKAFQMLLEEGGSDLELHLAGSCAGDDAVIIQQIKDCSPNRIIYYGAVTQKRLGEIFRKCDILILPSFYEGLPLVIIEGLASGLRVVSTDLPGVRDFLGEKITMSGAINFISLPRLKGVDEPFPEDLPSFEERICQSVTRQINLLKGDNPWKQADFFNALHDLSWERLFQKMEADIEEMLL
ncbi:glycosyltransferase family 4 protein [Sporomusa ovata]